MERDGNKQGNKFAIFAGGCFSSPPFSFLFPKPIMTNKENVKRKTEAIEDRIRVLSFIKGDYRKAILLQKFLNEIEYRKAVYALMYLKKEKDAKTK